MVTLCDVLQNIKSGESPISRSFITECWVGFVFISPLEKTCGSNVRCMIKELKYPTSSDNWRIASRNGKLSMSPTVPPTSQITISYFLLSDNW